MGHSFLRKFEIDSKAPESSFMFYDGRIQSICMKETQFENERTSFDFYSKVLSLSGHDQCAFFLTAITLDAIATNMKFNGVATSAMNIALNQRERYSETSTIFEADNCSSKTSSSSFENSSSSFCASSSSAAFKVACNYDKSPAKKELSDKAADILFNNPVIFFVKNSSPSIIYSLCSSQLFLPDYSQTEKVEFILFVETL